MLRKYLSTSFFFHFHCIPSFQDFTYHYKAHSFICHRYTKSCLSMVLEALKPNPQCEIKKPKEYRCKFKTIAYFCCICFVTFTVTQIRINTSYVSVIIERSSLEIIFELIIIYKASIVVNTLLYDLLSSDTQIFKIMKNYRIGFDNKIYDMQQCNVIKAHYYYCYCDLVNHYCYYPIVLPVCKLLKLLKPTPSIINACVPE